MISDCPLHTGSRYRASRVSPPRPPSELSHVEFSITVFPWNRIGPPLRYTPPPLASVFEAVFPSLDGLSTGDYESRQEVFTTVVSDVLFSAQTNEDGTVKTDQNGDPIYWLTEDGETFYEVVGIPDGTDEEIEN